MAANQLTDTECRKAKPTDKDRILTDGAGLYLLIKPGGSKLWRVRFTLDGRAGMFAAGHYPDVTLADARDKATWVRKRAQAGIHPLTAREEELEAVRQDARRTAEIERAGTFRRLAEDWIAFMAKTRWSDRYTAQIELRFAKYVYPAIGDMALSDINSATFWGPDDKPGFMRKLGGHSPTTAIALRACLSQVFNYGKATDRFRGEDPAFAMRGIVHQPAKRHRAAATELEQARAVLAAVEGATGRDPMVRLVHRFLALTGVRAGEAIGARWAEFTDLDGEAPTWNIPAERMKGRRDKKRPHIVPLSPGAIEVLKAAWLMRATKGAGADIVFRCQGRRTTINPSTMSAVLKALDLPVPHVPHGWRSAFSSIMNEAFPNDRHVIDLMLAHQLRGGVSAVEGHYNRAAFITRRRELADAWSAMLLEGAPSAFTIVGVEPPAAKVIKIRRAA